MANKYGSVDPVGNSEHSSRMSQMELWRESMNRTDKLTHTTVEVAKNENEKRADLEQRVRNGQEPCKTCASRTYKDDSHDGSVSFQAPRHLNASTAGLAVMSHEHEHVSHEGADAAEQGGQVVSSSVSLQYAKCPECGRTYVAGGTTKTVTRTPVKDRFRRLDASI